MQLGWIDFSKEDREKVLDVMNLLQEQGAVDEIGIGLVRDAFSNLFFPGTSTVQTVAKYFLIVPYVLKEACEGKYGTNLNKVLQRIDQEEKDCGIILLQNCPGEDGIIGRRVLPKRWVARKPSNIYWNGIRTYGICTQDLTIPELLKAAMVLQSYKKTTSLGNRGDDAEGSDKDDLDAGNDYSMQLFSVPDDYYGDWRTGLTVGLTHGEASFLRSMIETNTNGSLLSYLLKNNIDIDRYETFEAIYEDLHAKVPKEMEHQMRLACEFNRLVYAARVRYNYILSAGQNADAVDEWNDVVSNAAYMVAVDIDEVLEMLNITNFKLRRFLTAFKMSVLAGDWDAADKALIDREVEIKTKSRAKLLKRDDYSNDIWVGGRYLDYRFFSAKRIIDDIYKGEEATHV